MKSLIKYFFYLPLFLSIMNLQGFMSRIFGFTEAFVQLFAYANVLSVLVGTLFWFRFRKTYVPGIYLWFLFYFLYYFFALLANFFYDTQPHRLMPSFIPLVFFWGFSVFLSNPENRTTARKLLAGTFFTTSVFIILFYRFNISLDVSGVSEFAISRSGGVYGDANNACLSALLGLILVKYAFQPQSRSSRVLKSLAILVSLYAVVLTFSKTGFLILLIVLGVMYRSWFNMRRIVFVSIALPLFLILLFNLVVSRNWLNPSQMERVKDIGNVLTFNFEEVNFSGRDMLLANMIRYIEQHALIGNGVQFGESIRGHNTIMGVWADAGFLVFILFLFILVYYLVNALKIKDNRKIMVSLSLFTIYIYMLSLQTIINQGYFMALFAFFAYEIDHKYKTGDVGDQV